ncbi:hypothetical protein BJ912DRAFT_121315 [Pholiota molesta]|nr:hypothetical protein BJ912DRAFT_121315 [Pholiota molesta]
MGWGSIAVRFVDVCLWTWNASTTIIDGPHFDAPQSSADLMSWLLRFPQPCTLPAHPSPLNARHCECLYYVRSLITPLPAIDQGEDDVDAYFVGATPVRLSTVGPYGASLAREGSSAGDWLSLVRIAPPFLALHVSRCSWMGGSRIERDARWSAYLTSAAVTLPKLVHGRKAGNGGRRWLELRASRRAAGARGAADGSGMRTLCIAAALAWVVIGFYGRRLKRGWVSAPMLCIRVSRA